MTGRRRSGSRLGRRLLGLYSRSFRERWGDDALEVLDRDLEAAGGPGHPGRARVLARFAANGVADRLQRIGRTLASDGLWWGWGQDVRHAFRSAGRRLGFTTVAVGSLAVGVGANAVVFAVVDTLLLREIPGAHAPDRMVELSLVHTTMQAGSWNVPDFVDVSAAVPEIESAALVERGPVSLAEDGAGRRVLALYTTSRYFDVVGVSLARGRPFPESVDRGFGDHRYVVLSHTTWAERFDGDPGIVGRTVRINRTPYTVTGVVPGDFDGHQFGLQPAVYLPLTQYPAARTDPERFFGSRGTLWASAIARMTPGEDLAGVNAALATVMARLEEAYPTSNAGRSARAAQAALMPADGRVAASVVFGLLGSLMLLVLGATSANVGGMLLARASARQREMAVRMALGSGRARIVRHLLSESLVVFALGGALGVALAFQGMRAFERASALPTFLPVRLDFALDGRMIAYSLALTGVVGLVFGLIPALGATRGDIQSTLREGGGVAGPAGNRMRRAFVAGQVAVSILLLASASLFLRSLNAGEQVDTGFDPSGVTMVGFDLALEGYGDPASGSLFLDRLLERIRAMPDADGAAVATDFPLDGGSSSSPVWHEGLGPRESGGIQSYYARVSDGYFETLGIARVAGRTFGPDDGRLTPRVVVINRYLAEAAWPGESALGHAVEFGLDSQAYEVIGVVEDTQSDLITDEPAPQIFTLVDQDFDSDLYLAVRQRGDAPDFAARLRREILAVDPALALSDPRSLEEMAGLGMLPQRLVATIAGSLGMLALLLSAIGVYGVVAFTVTRRTREIGVRIALGSSRRRVLGGVLLDGLRLTWPGFAVGVPLAMALGAVARGLLLGVSPLDPLSYASVAGVFALVVACASYFPARRASGVQPVEALRAE